MVASRSPTGRIRSRSWNGRPLLASPRRIAIVPPSGICSACVSCEACRGWEDRCGNFAWWGRGHGDWHGGRWERGGACFYKDPGFGGGFFCLRRGEQRESLSDYGDKISSIRVFGNARVTVYDDRNFRGANANLNHDRPDLRDWRVKQKSGHSWNDRISSLAVQ